MRAIFGVILFVATGALACEPCPQDGTENVAATIREADLVVIAVSDGDAKRGKHEGPKWTKLKVERVLKGKLDGKHLEARAWFGMCSYGIVLDAGTHVVFLAKGNDGWTSVRQGCAAKSLPVVNGLVEDGGAKLTPEALVARALKPKS